MSGFAVEVATAAASCVPMGSAISEGAFGPAASVGNPVSRGSNGEFKVIFASISRHRASISLSLPPSLGPPCVGTNLRPALPGNVCPPPCSDELVCVPDCAGESAPPPLDTAPPVDDAPDTAPEIAEPGTINAEAALLLVGSAGPECDASSAAAAAAATCADCDADEADDE